MFDSDVNTLDPTATLAAAAEARAVVDQAEVRLLDIAAHWGNLHGHLEPGVDNRSLPGMSGSSALAGRVRPR